MEITSSKLHADTGVILDRVLSGQEITITRYGRPVAKLIPVRPEEQPTEVTAPKN